MAGIDFYSQLSTPSPSPQSLEEVASPSAGQVIEMSLSKADQSTLSGERNPEQSDPS